MHTYRSQRVVTPTGTQSADVTVDRGVIVAVQDWGCSEGAVTDFGDAVLSPGLIDAHCHINQPGRTHWEGFATATRAAAAGGITLLCDMPLNSEPVTTTGLAFDQKVEVSNGLLHVNVALYGGVIPDNAGDQQTLNELSRAGAAAFKCFLCDSGLSSFPAASRHDLQSAMPEIRRLGRRLLAHAELFGPASARSSAPLSYREALEARPDQAELDAIDLLAELCEQTQCAVHIVHLSSARALPKLAALKAAGLPITVETCPHYLTFCAEDLDLDPRFKCTPPIRSRANRDALWQGLADGTIDFIATDHSPCSPEVKFTRAETASRGWHEAWGGIASLQLLLPAVASQALKRGHTYEDISQWLSETPASWLGLDDRGAIEVGQRADLVAWWPDRSFVVRGEELEHRHPATPYEGIELQGVVEATVLGGAVIYDREKPCERKPNGVVLRSRLGTVGEHPQLEVARLNTLTRSELHHSLKTCCGAEAWALAVCQQRPFQRAQQLIQASEIAFDGLTRDDWLEAFAAHPRIGDLGSLKRKFADTASLASAEQAGTASANTATLEALAQKNSEYEARFGHVFLICASGRSAASMLSDLERRLGHERELEFSIACEEQRKITFLRLQQLLAQQPTATTDQPPPR